jgi:hypothetical protein
MVQAPTPHGARCAPRAALDDALAPVSALLQTQAQLQKAGLYGRVE